MGDFVNGTPKTINELKTNLDKLHENLNRVSEWRLDASSSKLYIDLDWKANKLGGVSDFYINIKSNKLNEAKAVIERFFSSSGHKPTDTEVAEFFSFVDTSRG